MKKVCAWCGKDMGEVPPVENTSTTHGMCPECYKNFKLERNLEAVIALEASKFEAPELLDMDNSRKARRSRQYGKSDSWKSKFNRNR